MNTVAVLKLTLHHAVVGYLAGFQSGKNILVFTDSFPLGSATSRP